MFINQISVFIENRPGRLSAITKVLGENNIDIRALSLADTMNFGILRLIVNKPGEAEKILRGKRLYGQHNQGSRRAGRGRAGADSTGCWSASLRHRSPWSTHMRSSPVKPTARL